MDETGLLLPRPQDTHRSTCVELAAMADDRVDAIWIGESWNHNSVVLMTQVAEATGSADVCSGIFNVYSRTPALVALTAASLADVAGDDRVRVGLGTSGPAVVENFHGVGFERPLRRTREYVEIVRAFLSGGRVDYDGEVFDLAGFGIDAPDAEVPIYVASMGEKNLELTGAFADGWLPLMVPKGELGSAMEHIERGADDRNRTLDDVAVAPYVPTCISEDDPEGARDLARSLIAFYVGAMGDFYANAVSRFGYPDEAAAIQDGWEGGGTDAAATAVTDDMLADFAACGTPDEAAESFDEFREAGADMPVAYVPAHWASDDVIEETIRHL